MQTLKPIEAPKPNSEESYTKVIDQHIPSGSCVYSEFAYDRATERYICFKEFQELNPKVRDHRHYTGQY